MPATARLIVMMEKDEKEALEAQAEAASVSTAELVRRRLFGRHQPEERAFLQMLADLKPLAQKASRTVETTLAEIRSLRESADERDARIAERARVELTRDELASVAGRLHLGARRSSSRHRRGARA